MRKLMALASAMVLMLVVAAPAFAQSGFQNPYVDGSFAHYYLDGGFAQQYQDDDFVDGYVDMYPHGNVYINNWR